MTSNLDSRTEVFSFFITEVIVSFEEEISLAGFHSVRRYIDY